MEYLIRVDRPNSESMFLAIKNSSFEMVIVVLNSMKNNHTKVQVACV